MQKREVVVFWFRRDLRLVDNAGLYHALRNGLPVLPVFIFDTDILDDLNDKADKRMTFIYRQIKSLKTELQKLGSDLLVLHGKPVEVFQQLLNQFDFKSAYTNHDYEPYALKRDADIAKLLASRGGAFYTFKDQVIFEKGEVLKEDGLPYTVFTPYSKKWKARLASFYLKPYPTGNYFSAFLRLPSEKLIPLEEVGFTPVDMDFPGMDFNPEKITTYDATRDIPSLNGTSRLSVHLRFGTISIRRLAGLALSLNEKFLDELIWRDFYQMILAHFPHVVGASFKKEYDKIPWLNSEADFEAWKNGMTGFPLVDAGMRELNETGFMHNRVRMVTASFLTKHLLIDWRWGEAYFASKLLDYELASNNGGWQWAAGCGVDAAPYFRVFNPTIQTQKFDPELIYIKHWVREFNSSDYQQPIVDHAFARDRAIKHYKKFLG